MDLKRLIVFSATGEGMAIAWQAKRAGLDVIVGMVQNLKDTLTSEEQENFKPEKPDEKERRLLSYQGMLDIFPAERVVKILQKLSDEEKKETFVFCDLNYLFKFANEVKVLGIPGFYPTEDDRRFEADREAGKQFVKSYYPDLKVAEFHEFKTVEEALVFLEEDENMWVLKGYSSSAETFVPKTEDKITAKQQLIEALEVGKKEYESAGFLLEKKICNPLEITPQAIFYDGEFVFADCDIELKHKGAGDTDVQVGCGANLIFPLTMQDKIFNVAFPPKVFEMAKMHKGMFVWDASILIDPENGEMYFGEFCANRCGYDAVYTEIELAGGVREFFGSIMQKKSPFENIEFPAGIGVRIFSPHCDDVLPCTTRQDTELMVNPDTLNHIWPIYTYGKEDKIMSTGYAKDIACITGKGKNFKEAVEQCFKYLKGVSFEDMQYRYMYDILCDSYPTSILRRYNYGKFYLFSCDIGEGMNPAPVYIDPETIRAEAEEKNKEERARLQSEFDEKLRLLEEQHENKRKEDISKIREEINIILYGTTETVPKK